jgi:hypothetical protein
MGANFCIGKVWNRLAQRRVFSFQDFNEHVVQDLHGRFPIGAF